MNALAPITSVQEVTPRIRVVPDLPAREKVETDLAGKATAEQIAILANLLDEARSRGLTTFAGVGKMIQRDASTISRVMRGEYPADLGPLCSHVRGFLDDYVAGISDEEPFEVGLSVVKVVVPFCGLVRETRQVGVIWGENQSGKTKALEHYAATNADTCYARLPAGGSAKRSMRVIATALGISESNSDVQLRDRIMRRMTRRTLLIVDEFHQAVNGRTLKTDTIERIREIHDLCGCGVVLCGTHVVNEMIADPRFKRFLGQIDNRGALRLNIPKAPTARDRALLFSAYHLPAPDTATAKAVKEICDTNGIARMTDLFKIAKRMAVKKSEALGWSHFNATVTTLKAWASGEFAQEEK